MNARNILSLLSAFFVALAPAMAEEKENSKEASSSAAEPAAEATAEPAEKKSRKKSRPDWEEVDAADFAAKLKSASGEKWAQTPETIIVEYAGPFVSESGEKASQHRTISIRSKGEEIGKRLSVILVDDKLFDDATKTKRVRLQLGRGKDDAWKLRKAFEADEPWPAP